MPREVRGFAAWSIVALGLIAALLKGPEYPQCLGPIGVTQIQCVSATGHYPNVGIGIMLLAIAVASATLLSIPPGVERQRGALLGAVIGPIVGGGVYLLLRPTSITGPSSTGAIITLDVPFDVRALVTAAAFAAAVASAALSWKMAPQLAAE